MTALLLGGCGSNDTRDPPAELTEFTPEAKFKSLWKKDTGKGSKKFVLWLKPFFTGDTVYVADIKGKITALDKTTGKTRWKVKTDLPITGGVGGGGGLLFVGTRKGELVALRQQNGEILWRSRLTSESLTVPAVDLGVVVTRSADGNIQAFSAGSGEKLWSYTHSAPALTQRGNGDPVIYAGGVLVGADNGRFTALSVSNGRLLRETPIAVPSGSSELSRMVDIDAKALVGGGYIYVAALNGRVVSISLENGQVAWSRDLSVYRDMSMDDDNLYVADDSGHIWALNRATGATVWVQDKLHARPITGTNVYRGTVMVGDHEGYVHAMDIADGRFIARTRVTKKDIKVEPFVNDGRVYILTRKGVLAALSIERLAETKS